MAHRTNATDWVDIGGGRHGYSETGSGTVVDEYAANMWQEEICLAVVGAGLTLRSDGPSDVSGNYGQLLQAIREMNWISCTQSGADSSGATSSVTAINAAIALAYGGSKGNVCFLPPGTYLIDGVVNIPEGIIFVGVRGKSILKPAAGFSFTFTGESIIQDIFIYNSASVAGLTGIDVDFINDTKVGYLYNVDIRGFAKALDTSRNDSNNYGELIVRGGEYRNNTIAFNITDLTNLYSCRIDCMNTKLKFNDTQINDDAQNGPDKIVFSNVDIFDGIMNISGHTSIIHSRIDVDSWTLATPNVLNIGQNLMGPTLANTIVRSGTSVGTLNARGNRWMGTPVVQNKYTSIRGNWIERDLTANQSIPNHLSNWNIVLFPNEVFQSGVFNPSGLGLDSYYSAGTFTATSLCEGELRILCRVITSVNHEDVQVILKTSSGSIYIFTHVELPVDAVYGFDGTIRLAAGDTFQILIFNNTGPAINVLDDVAIGSETIKTFIEIEGL